MSSPTNDHPPEQKTSAQLLVSLGGLSPRPVPLAPSPGRGNDAPFGPCSFSRCRQAFRWQHDLSQFGCRPQRTSLTRGSSHPYYIGPFPNERLHEDPSHHRPSPPPHWSNLGIIPQRNGWNQVLGFWLGFSPSPQRNKTPPRTLSKEVSRSSPREALSPSGWRCRPSSGLCLLVYYTTALVLAALLDFPLITSV